MCSGAEDACLEFRLIDGNGDVIEPVVIEIYGCESCFDTSFDKLWRGIMQNYGRSGT